MPTTYGERNRSKEHEQPAAEQDEENGEKRNHRRSKRKKNVKDPVGISPPTPQPKNDDRHPFPLSNLGGGSSWEKERERGE